LSANDRLAAITAVIVIITGLISLNNDWGILMGLSLLAGVGALVVVLLPVVAPTAKLPVSKGMSLLAMGGVATVAFLLTAFNWVGWIFDHLVAVDTLQFLVGLVAAIVLLYAGWRAYQAEKGTTSVAG